jgi:hypothetical protein
MYLKKIQVRCCWYTFMHFIHIASSITISGYQVVDWDLRYKE